MAARAFQALTDQVYAAFGAEAERTPAMSLRGGDAVDGYDCPPPYDASLDEPTDAYLQRYSWGMGYLISA